MCKRKGSLYSVAFDEAIKNTTQTTSTLQPIDKIIEIFLLYKKLIVANIKDPGERSIYRFGSPFGFYLLHDFSGMNYYFLGNFTALRPEMIIWRLTMINELLNARKASMKKRVELGLIQPEKRKTAEALFSYLQLLVIVTRDEDKSAIELAMKNIKFAYPLELFSIADINIEISNLDKSIS